MSPKHTGSAVKHSIIDVENEESETQQAAECAICPLRPGLEPSSKMASPLPTATTLASTPGAAHADNPFSAEESREVQVPGHRTSSGKDSGKETAAPGVASTSTPSTADDPAARRVQTAAIVMSTFLQLLDYGTDCYLYFSFCPMLYHWELPGEDLWENADFDFRRSMWYRYRDLYNDGKVGANWREQSEAAYQKYQWVPTVLYPLLLSLAPVFVILPWLFYLAAEGMRRAEIVGASFPRYIRRSAIFQSHLVYVAWKEIWADPGDLVWRRARGALKEVEALYESALSAFVSGVLLYLSVLCRLQATPFPPFLYAAMGASIVFTISGGSVGAWSASKLQGKKISGAPLPFIIAYAADLLHLLYFGQAISHNVFLQGLADTSLFGGSGTSFAVTFALLGYLIFIMPFVIMVAGGFVALSGSEKAMPLFSRALRRYPFPRCYDFITTIGNVLHSTNVADYPARALSVGGVSIWLVRFHVLIAWAINEPAPLPYKWVPLLFAIQMVAYARLWAQMTESESGVAAVIRFMWGGFLWRSAPRQVPSFPPWDLTLPALAALQDDWVRDALEDALLRVDADAALQALAATTVASAFEEATLRTALSEVDWETADAETLRAALATAPVGRAGRRPLPTIAEARPCVVPITALTSDSFSGTSPETDSSPTVFISHVGATGSVAGVLRSHLFTQTFVTAAIAVGAFLGVFLLLVLSFAAPVPGTPLHSALTSITIAVVAGVPGAAVAWAVVGAYLPPLAPWRWSRSVLWIAPQRSAAYEPLEVVTNVRKVVVIYMPETHKDLLDSLQRRVQRDAQETIATKDLGMLLKPISASEALYARAVDQIFFHDPNGMAQLLAIESYGTFEGKLRARSDARGSREDWVKQYTSNLDDIMRDAAEAQALLVETFSNGSGFQPGTPTERRHDRYTSEDDSDCAEDQPLSPQPAKLRSPRSGKTSGAGSGKTSGADLTPTSGSTPVLWAQRSAAFSARRMVSPLPVKPRGRSIQAFASIVPGQVDPPSPAPSSRFGETFNAQYSIINPGLKRRERVEEKANARQGTAASPPYDTLVDIARMSLAFRTPAGLVACVRHLLHMHERGELTLFWIENKFQRPSALGYRDVNVGVGIHLANGRVHISEMQLNLQTILNAKDQGHSAYEAIRSMLPILCPGSPVKHERIQHVILDELKKPRTATNGYFSDMRAVSELAASVRAKKKIVFLGLRWPAWWNPMRWICVARLDLDEALTLASFQVRRTRCASPIEKADTLRRLRREWGSEAAFDQFVREELPGTILEAKRRWFRRPVELLMESLAMLLGAAG
jgi:hypothetical protein